MSSYNRLSLIIDRKYYTLYKGLNLEGDQVWLKVLHPNFLYSPNFSLLFDKWAEKLKQINCSICPKYLDFVKEYSDYIIVTEYFELNPLAEIIDNLIFNNLTIKNIFLSILEAFEHLHNINILNGFITPNQLHLINFEPVVEDLGLNNLLLGSLTNQEKNLTNYDLRFCAPEIITGQNIDRRTDIYSLGTILYTLVFQKVPFDKITDRDKLKQLVLNQQLITDKEDSNIFSPIIKKATEKAPNNRYQTVRQLIEDLKKIETQPLPKTSQSQNIASRGYFYKKANVSSKTSKKKKRKTNLIKLITIILLLVINVFLIIDFINILSKPANSKLIYVNHSILTMKAFYFNHKYFIAASSLYDNTLLTFGDSLNLINATVLDYNDIIIKSIDFADGIFYFSGNKFFNNNTYIPVLYITYSIYYEPYYNFEITGEYSVVKIHNKSIYLIRKQVTDYESTKIFLEKRNLDLSIDTILYLSSFNPDELIKPKDIFFIKDRIIIKFKTLNQNLLQAYDTNGIMIWSKEFYDQTYNDLRTQNLLTTRKGLLLATVETNNKIHLYFLNLYGKILNNQDIKIKEEKITDISKILKINQNIYLFVNSTKKSKILKVDKNFNLIWEKSIKGSGKLTILDALVTSDSIITVFGTTSYNYINLLTNQINYFIYITQIDTNGSYQTPNLFQMAKQFISNE